MAKLIRLYVADEVVITAIFTQRFRIDGHAAMQSTQTATLIRQIVCNIGHPHTLSKTNKSPCNPIDSVGGARSRRNSARDRRNDEFQLSVHSSRRRQGSDESLCRCSEANARLTTGPLSKVHASCAFEIRAVRFLDGRDPMRPRVRQLMCADNLCLGILRWKISSVGSRVQIASWTPTGRFEPPPTPLACFRRRSPPPICGSRPS
jgi:hypothetical protein